MAFVEFEFARLALLDYVGGDKKRFTVYFRALHHFEIAVSLVYQSYDLLRQFTGEDLFDQNDRSPLDRLNSIYNFGRHIRNERIPQYHLHAVWLSNNEIHVSTDSDGGTDSISYFELAQLIKEMGDFAKAASDPRKLKKEIGVRRSAGSDTAGT